MTSLRWNLNDVACPVFGFAEKDLKGFDRYHQKVIDKAIKKVVENSGVDGYGKLLGNKSGKHCTGYIRLSSKIRHSDCVRTDSNGE